MARFPLELDLRLYSRAHPHIQLPLKLDPFLSLLAMKAEMTLPIPILILQLRKH